MRKKVTKTLSMLLALLMVLSVISIPSIRANAEGGVDGFVERCYTVTLDRGSDPDGFADWKDQLLNGKSVGVNIAYGFLFSSEYKNKNKSNEDYVKDLYKLFMDREPDEGGFNDWTGKLENGASKEEVFAGFANSQEFYNICESYGITAGYFAIGYDRNQVNNVNLFVERLYQTCLGRRGDRGGQKDWVNKLLKKEITGVECARCFIQSKEYTNQGLSDNDYVEDLYRALMGRASDSNGKASWLDLLERGMTRDEVFAGFANSKEFGDICSAYKIEKGSYTAKNIGILKEKKNDKKYRLIKESTEMFNLSNEEQVVNSDIYTYTYDDNINSTIPVKGEDFNVLANKVFDKFEYEFDDEGKLIKKTCLSYSGPGQYSESDRDEYKYNEKGYMTEDCYYHKNLLSKITRYNDKGEITEEINYIDGILYDRITYTMDSEGRRSSGCLYKDGEKYENYSTFVYNAEGLLIRYEENEDDGEYLHVYTYEYDSHGNMTKMNIYSKHIMDSHSYSESNDTYEYVLTYDSNGNIIKKITYTTHGYGMAKQYESVYEYEEVPTMEKDK